MADGMIPNFTSEVANTAAVEATQMSQAEAHFGHRELRLLHRHGEVGAGDQADRAGEGVAVHARDHRLRTGVDGVQEQSQTAGIGTILRLGKCRHALHPVQVGAGGEALAVAAEHDRTHRVVLAHGVERIGQLGDQRLVEGIVHFGTIQRQRGHAVLGFED